jgi:choice-of-anchor B domain-containing protein
MQRILYFLLCVLYLSTTASAQNLNTTFRAKMTFSNQTLANIWGYTGRDGKEYALLGAAKGLIIVDISNPDAPNQIVQIPGPNNLWKEIKTYSHYAYIVSEGGMGIQVVDLKGLPSPNLSYHYYKGDGAINNQLNAIHALHIDVNKGFLYAWGGNLFNGGAKIFDLKSDPYNPKYVGKYDQLGYIHDGFVDQDTMFSGHIYAGQFAIVNMANKNAAELLATQGTPGAFTHNTWPTDDRKTLFTTDEINNSFLSAFDISDPTDIKLLDKIQSNPGSNSIVHNTYILRNWAITSWYKDGFTIVDASKPDNLVQVGNYDTYPTAGSGFDGCWGVYPFFPSGTLIASNINALNTGNGELFIVTPDYHRACYLEGLITDAVTGQSLNNAKIEVLGSTPLTQELSTSSGIYKTGQATSGYFNIRVSKSGYQNYETLAFLKEGDVTIVNAALFPNGTFSITGTALRQSDNQPVDGATIWLYGAISTNSTTTDPNGLFSFPSVTPGVYNIVAEAPGLGLAELFGQTIASTQDVTLVLSDVFKRDNFAKKNKGNFLVANNNPFSESLALQFSTPEQGAVITVQNSLGQILQTVEPSGNSGAVVVGQNLPAGAYFLRLELKGQLLQTIKVLKN